MGVFLLVVRLKMSDDPITQPDVSEDSEGDSDRDSQSTEPLSDNEAEDYARELGFYHVFDCHVCDEEVLVKPGVIFGVKKCFNCRWDICFCAACNQNRCWLCKKCNTWNRDYQNGVVGH